MLTRGICNRERKTYLINLSHLPQTLRHPLRPSQAHLTSRLQRLRHRPPYPYPYPPTTHLPPRNLQRRCNRQRILNPHARAQPMERTARMRRIPRNHDAAPRVGRRRVVRHVEDGPLGQALGEQGDEGADGGAPGGEGLLDFGAGAGGGELRGGG